MTRKNMLRAERGMLNLQLPRTAQARRLLQKRGRFVALLQEEWRAHEAAAAHVEVYFVDEPTIQQLHRDYLNDPSSTDIITFELGPSPEQIQVGTLYICPEVAARFAARFKVSVSEEVHRLIAHGILHLLGYDDRTPVDKRRMRRAENRILTRFAMKEPNRAGKRIPT